MPATEEFFAVLPARYGPKRRSVLCGAAQSAAQWLTRVWTSPPTSLQCPGSPVSTIVHRYLQCWLPSATGHASMYP